jgi:glucokinase
VEFPFPVLLCDIGGTHIRFAAVKAPGAPVEPGPHLFTKDYPGLEAAAAEAMAAQAVRPRSLIACAAGPVAGRSVKMTNADWIIDGARAATAAGLEQGLLLNDFEAQALSLPLLEPAWVKTIGEAATAGPGTQLVMGLGTGLGVAALAWTGEKWLALPSEAGHMDFGPLGDRETALWPLIEKDPAGRVCAEAILSGPGLMRLHRARCAASGERPGVPDEITLIREAHARPDGPEAATLRLCWQLAARFAGDLALAFLAKGGVTLSGGVLPRITAFCDPLAFRAAFENKPPYAGLLRGIGTRLIIAADSVFAGMAAVAASPCRYAIDYSARAWR